MQDSTSSEACDAVRVSVLVLDINFDGLLDQIYS